MVGVPAFKTTFSLTPESQLGGLAEDRVSMDVRLDAEDGRSEKIGAVFQRRGRVVALIYTESVTTALPCARVVAANLAGLDPSDAGE